MLIVTTKILISQTPSEAFPTRNNEFDLDFVVEFEANDGWRDFTNECKITLPKKFKYISTTGNPVYPGNPNENISGFLENMPLFLKGDEVTLISGYTYKLGDTTYVDTAIIFEGFISKVSSKRPFTLSCEDNMYKLKQIPAPNKLFLGSQYTLETMLTELLAGTGFTVNQTAQTNIGDFRTLNETVMDVVARLRKDYHFEAYFIGNQLYCGALVVYLNPGQNYQFVFQENIIEDELEYNRKDDVVLSALAYSINKIELQTLTKDGAVKTKHQRLEVLVTYQNGKFTSKINPPGQKADFPPNYTGERRTLYFWNVTDSNKLVTLAQAELMKYYYTGLKGKFTTFGIPFVKQGDNAEIYDTILPERNGMYKIKGVEYKFSVQGGLRQIIELDYRIGDNIDAMPKLS